MTPEEEKNIETEVRNILLRWVPDLPDWDDISNREKAALFAEIMKEHTGIWKSFSFKQQRWLMRQMGFIRWNSALGGKGIISAGILYLLLTRPKLCCSIFIVIVLVLWVASRLPE